MGQWGRFAALLPAAIAAAMFLSLPAANAAEPKHKGKHTSGHPQEHARKPAPAARAPAPASTPAPAPAACPPAPVVLTETGITSASQRGFVALTDLTGDAVSAGQHCIALTAQDAPAFDGPVAATLSVLGMAMRTDHGTYNVTVDETGYDAGRPFVRYTVTAKNASVTHLGLQAFLRTPAEPANGGLTRADGDARYLTRAAADARYIRDDGREIVHFGDMLKLWHVPQVGPEKGQNCLDFGLPQGVDTGKDAAVMSMEAVSCKAGEFSLRWQLHSATTVER
jgi:hypothetical protein